MEEKSEVLDAVLKETVDLVMDLITELNGFLIVGCVIFLHMRCLLKCLFFILLVWLQENIPIDEVFENLRCTRKGLTTAAAEERLAIFWT